MPIDFHRTSSVWLDVALAPFSNVVYFVYGARFIYEIELALAKGVNAIWQ